MKTFLLSHPINESTPLYGGKDNVDVYLEKSIKNNDSSNVLRLKLSTHTSTHIDMPSHFIEDGDTLTDYETEQWVFHNVVLKSLNLGTDAILSEQNFKEDAPNKNIELLIIKTGFEKYRGSSEYVHNSPIVLANLAGFLKIKYPRLRAIGFDFISLSALRNREEGRRAHKEFLGRDILIIEDMKLSNLYSCPDLILVSPLLVDRADGSPVSVWGFFHNFDINRYDYFLFDFDGVILDSVQIKTAAYADLYAENGPEVVKKVIAHHILNGGISRYEKFRYYHKELLDTELTDHEVDALANKFSKIVFNKVAKSAFIEGAKEFLALLQQKDKKCMIVTGTPESEILEIIKHRKLDRYFLTVRGSPQRKKDIVREIINCYQINTKEAVFFGDSSTDLIAANETGIRFYGINYSDFSCPPLGYKNFNALLNGSRQ